MKKIINTINEDFFDDIESKVIINDKIEQVDDTINPKDYTHVLKLSLEIAENSVFIKNIREQKNPYTLVKDNEPESFIKVITY